MMYQQWGLGELGGWAATVGPWLVPIAIWSIIWKGLALWRAARREEKVWFIALLVVNTVGILEIIYLLLTNRKQAATPPAQQ